MRWRADAQVEFLTNQWGNFKVGDWKGWGCSRLKRGFLKRISELEALARGGVG